MTSTDLSAQVLALPVVALTVFTMNSTVPWRVARTLTTQALTSSEAGQIGGSSTFPQAVLRRHGAGERVLTLLACPPLFTVTSATVTLSMT